MLGKPKPVVLESSYGARRQRRGPPGWLIALFVGILIGVGGLLLGQARFSEPRLSVEESTGLRSDAERAESERKRLQGELVSATARMEAALRDKKNLSDELAKSRQTAERQRDDVAAVLAALPPDARGGPIEVRAGRFNVEGGKLAYNLVLSRKRAEGAPFSGVVQLVVSGSSGAGGATAFIANPLPVSVDQHQTLRGSVPLPDGFKPKQATIKVLDKVDGKQQGMRVLFVE